MKGLWKILGILSLLLAVLASCNVSADSSDEEIPEPEDVLIYVDGILIPEHTTITIMEWQTIELYVEYVDGEPLSSLGLGHTMTEYGSLFNITWPATSTAEISVLRTQEESSRLYIYDGQLELTYIYLDIRTESYLDIPGYTNPSVIQHGDIEEISFNSDISPDLINWTVSGDGSVEIGVITETDYHSGAISINAVSPGDVTITATSDSNPSISASYEMTVNLRDVEITPTQSFPHLMSQGDSVLIADIFDVSYVTQPAMTLPELNQEVSISFNNSNLTQTAGTLNAVLEGATSMTVASVYNPDVERDYGIRVLGEVTSQTLSAVVSDGNGSFAVSGSTVQLFEHGSDTEISSAVSDANGSVSFSDVSTGFYDLEVSGNGRAGSRLEHLFVGNQDRSVEIVQKEVSADSWPVEVPEVFLEEAPPYMIISEVTNIEATVDPASVLQVYQMRYNLGCFLISEDGVAQMIDSVDDTSLEVEIDPAGLTVGLFNEIAFIAYDVNNNRNEYRIPLENTSEASHTYTPGDRSYEQIDISAATYGSQMNVYFADPGSHHSVRIAVEEGSTSAYIDGINIYRSTVEGDVGTFIGSSSERASGEELGVYGGFVSSSYDWFYFKDTDPALVPGETYYYSVGYVKDGGDGELSDQVEITLLPSYSMELVSPADNSNVSGSPTFEWQAENGNDTQWAGLTYNTADTFVIVSSDVIEYVHSPENPITDGSTTFTLTSPLDSNTRYEWDVFSVRSISDITTYTCSLSVSMPRAPIYSTLFSAIFNGAALPLSSNGCYSFYQE